MIICPIIASRRGSAGSGGSVSQAAPRPVSAKPSDSNPAAHKVLVGGRRFTMRGRLRGMGVRRGIVAALATKGKQKILRRFSERAGRIENSGAKRVFLARPVRLARARRQDVPGF